MKAAIRKSLIRKFCKLAKNNRKAQIKILDAYLFETGCDALYGDLQNELRKKVYTDKNRTLGKRNRQPVQNYEPEMLESILTKVCNRGSQQDVENFLTNSALNIAFRAVEDDLEEYVFSLKRYSSARIPI